MYRVLYVPLSEEITSEVEDTAASLGIQILHGESAQTYRLAFDRQTIQVISIPSEKYHRYETEVPLGMHQVISVVDEFSYLGEDSVCVVDGVITIEPTVREDHRLSFSFIPNGPGLHVFDVFDRSKQCVAHGEFMVTNG